MIILHFKKGHVNNSPHQSLLTLQLSFLSPTQIHVGEAYHPHVRSNVGKFRVFRRHSSLHQCFKWQVAQLLLCNLIMK